MKEFRLRKFKRGDEGSLRKNINDKYIARNTLTIPYPYTVKDAKSWIKRNLKLYKSRKAESINFVIDINGEVAGSVSLCKIDRVNNNAEIGYWLSRKYQGKGIMTNAIKQITKYGFDKLKLKRIYGYVFVFNKTSQKVLEKTGFQLEGKLRKHVIKSGKYHNALLYAKVK